MRRTIVAVLLLAVLASCVGCFGGGAPTASKLPWGLKPHYYTFVDVVSCYDGLLNYTPDLGYEFLVINVSLSNISKKEEHLIGLDSEFAFVTASGNSYSVIGQYFACVNNHLPTIYPPQDYRTGDLYFQVPTNTNINAGKLMFTPFLSDTSLVVKLTDVPLK